MRMNEQIIDQVQNVFRRVFHNSHLEIKVTDTAHSIPGWDSLTHMTLINELEIDFKITFTFEEVSSFKNIGDMIHLISKKLS